MLLCFFFFLISHYGSNIQAQNVIINKVACLTGPFLEMLLKCYLSFIVNHWLLWTLSGWFRLWTSLNEIKQFSPIPQRKRW